MDLLLAYEPLPHLPSSQFPSPSLLPPPLRPPDAATDPAELHDFLHGFLGPMLFCLLISIVSACCLQWLHIFLRRLIYNARDQTPALDIESPHHSHDDFTDTLDQTAAPASDIESAHHSHDDYTLTLWRPIMQRWIQEKIEAVAPSFQFDKNRIEEGGLDGDMGCVICLENIKDGEICRVFSECNHIFHKACIGSWLVKKTTCPICRTSVLRTY